MPLLLLVLIAGVWAAFLLPPALQSRRSSPLNSTEEFSELTRQLGRARSAQTNLTELAVVHEAAAAGIDRDRVLARRRLILMGLIGTVVVTLIAAIAGGNLQLLLVHIMFDAGLVWYIAMLLQIKARQQAAESILDIRPLVSEGRPQFQVISNR